MAFSLFKKTAPAATPAPRSVTEVPVVNGIIDDPAPVEPVVVEEVIPVEPVAEASELNLSGLDAAAASLSGSRAAEAEQAGAEEPEVPVEPAEPAEGPAEVPVEPAEPAAAPAVASDDPVSAEQARLERERAARREARLAALAPVKEDDPLEPAPEPVVVRAAKPATHRLWGSLGLFVLRAVTAAILFVQGLNGVINPRPVLDLWSNTVLPYPRFIAMGVSWLQLAIALLLFFGLLTRLGGLLLAGLMAATLAFVLWGNWSIFEPGGAGFIGEQQLLLAAVGVALLGLGAGAWSFDHLLRRSREREGIGV